MEEIKDMNVDSANKNAADPYSGIEVDLKTLSTEEGKEQVDDKSTKGEKGEKVDSKTTKSDDKEPTDSDKVTPTEKPENPQEGDKWVNPEDEKTYIYGDEDWNEYIAKIKVHDKEYTEEELLEGLKDAQNKKKWQTENTQKSQDVAELRKSTEPLAEFIKVIKEKSPEVVELIEELIAEKDESVKKAFKDAFKLDITKYRSPFADENEQLKQEKEANERTKAFNEDSDALKKKFNLKESDIDDIVEYAKKRYEDSGVTMTLEEAFKAMDYDNIEEKKNVEIEKLKDKLKKEKEKTKIETPGKVDKTIGATDTKEPSKKIKDFDKIELGEYAGKLHDDEPKY